MRLYRNHLYSQEDNSEGHDFFTSKADAEKAWNKLARDRPNLERGGNVAVPFDFEPTKLGILHLCRRVGSHAENG